MRDLVWAAVAVLACCLLLLAPINQNVATAQVWVSADGQTVYTATPSTTVTYDVTPGPAIYVPASAPAPTVYGTAPAWRSGLVGNIVGGVVDGISNWRVARAKRVIAEAQARQAARAASSAVVTPATTYQYYSYPTVTINTVPLDATMAVVPLVGGRGAGIYWGSPW